MAPTGLPPRPADSEGKKWVFNVPPGWPAPSAGWQPDAGWRPDPLWPPAPAGWEFWKPAPQRPKREAKTYIKAAAAVLTFAATITGTYLAYLAIHDQPKVTTADWVRNANATCDQDTGALSQSLFDGLTAVGQANSSGQASSTGVAGGMVAAAGSVSKLVGDLGALQSPTDGGAPKVQAVLTTGNVIVDNLDAISNAATEAQYEKSLGASTTQEISLEQAAYKKFRVSLVAWQKAIGALGLRQCPFWVANPDAVPSPQPVVSPPPQPVPASSLNGGEQQLVSELNPDDFTNCIGRPDLEGNGIVAAINCQTVSAGPTQEPVIEQFSDVDEAAAWFREQTSGFSNDDDCAAGDMVGTWDHDYVTVGVLGCSYLTDGSFRIVWVFANPLIGIIADGANGEAMYSWWTNSAYAVSGPAG
jgi:hypothetical protein